MTKFEILAGLNKKIHNISQHVEMVWLPFSGEIIFDIALIGKYGNIQNVRNHLYLFIR